MPKNMVKDGKIIDIREDMSKMFIKKQNNEKDNF
jgi:hypothetical protein